MHGIGNMVMAVGRMAPQRHKDIATADETSVADEACTGQVTAVNEADDTGAVSEAD
jgi:hypothetical protein